MPRAAVAIVLAAALAAPASVAATVARVRLERRTASVALGGMAKSARAPAAPEAPGRLPLSNWHDTFYIGEVDLGTPGAPIRVGFDAGKSTSWVPVWAALAQDSTHSYFDPRASTTHQALNRRQFRDQGVTGKWARDVLAIAGLRVEEFEFGLATDVSGFAGGGYETQQYDGIIGLGFDGGRAPQLLQKLVQAGAIDAPIFAFYLGRESVSSELALGGVVPEHFQGRFRYVPVYSSNAWSVALDAVWIGDEVCFTDTTAAKVRPSISFLSGPQDQVKALLDAYGATKDSDGWWQIGCDAEGPSLHFRINGRDYTLSKQDMLVKWGEDCFLGFEELHANTEEWTLAQPFLRKYYVQFDAGGKTLGFALAKHDEGGFLV